MIEHGDENTFSPIICEISGDEGRLPMQANAHLIVAAPELLALAEAVLGFEIATPKDYATKGADAFSPMARHIINLQNQARAAIANARGEK